MNIAFVQARVGSERLEAKVLKPLLGKPMILHVLDRLSRSSQIDKVILATSDLPENDPLVELVSEAGYTVFRGSEDNVLDRYYQATEMFDADTIIRVTGDCPLIDPGIVDKVMYRYFSSCLDYMRLDVPQTFIRGFDIEVLSRSALHKTVVMADEPKYLEHVTYYIYTHPDQFLMDVYSGSEFYNKEYRLCVDTAQDFELVKTIFEHFNDPFVSAQQVIAYLDENPHLADINRETIQKTV